MPFQQVQPAAGGTRLRTLRASYARTQLDIELDAEIGIGYLQRLELGKVKHPERETLERILTALGANFAERRELLGLFGYAPTNSWPDPSETRRAVEVFRSEAIQDNLPAYLLDCSHRLLAWNPLVGKLFHAISGELGAMLMPRLIFDRAYGIASSVMNGESFFRAQVRILEFERQRCANNAWYEAFIDEMCQYPIFDEYWHEHNQSECTPLSMRPSTQLTLRIGQGIGRYRLISETFAQDPRFRVIYYMPADAETLRRCLTWQSESA